MEEDDYQKPMYLDLETKEAKEWPSKTESIHDELIVYKEKASPDVSYKIDWPDTPKLKMAASNKAGSQMKTAKEFYNLVLRMPYSTFVVGSGGVSPMFSTGYPWNKPMPTAIPKSGTPWWPTNGEFDVPSEYFPKLCVCGHTLGSHGGAKPHKCCKDYEGCTCPTFSIPEEEMPTIKKDVTKPPLDLMPGSVEADWHRYKNWGYDLGGWVYKTASVHAEAYIDKGVVVYGEAKVEAGCCLYDNTQVYGKAVIGYGSTTHGSPKIGGNAVIGKNCGIHNTAKIMGTLGNNCSISGRTYIRANVVVPAGTSWDKTPRDYRTQKARGLETLERNGFKAPKSEIYRIERMGTQAKLEKLIGKFVRPCPVTPRHGFVDSRPVTTMEEAVQIVKETKVADRKAELIVMPFIKATHSGVWTEGQLSIGLGHDGATSGRDSVMIPILGKPEHEKDWAKLLSEAGITQSPYLELLWEEELKLKYVQLRDGPKLPQTIDFIPAKIHVKHVIKAEGDLLAWETAVKGFEPGTVVWHPKGSLASHYAVHAYLSNIPVIVSREPKVGDTLEPNTTVPEAKIDELRKGFMLGCSISGSGTERKKYIQLAHIMLAGCHSVTQWLGTNDLLLGAAMGACYRLILSAAVGEFRHKSSSNLKGSTREGIYEKAWNCTLEQEMMTKFAEAMISFDKEEWSSSYGGPKWYILSRWGALIFNSLLDGDVKAALEALNKGVNSCHNGGWTFNKFLSEDEMTTTADNPIYALLKVAPLLYDAVNMKEVKEFKFEKYKVEELDPDKYLEERKKEAASSYSSSASGYNSKSAAKNCCKTECCGNPMCEDCHPAIMIGQNPKYTSCPAETTGKDGTFNHFGKITLIDDNSEPEGTKGLPACENHLEGYLTSNSGWELAKPVSSQSELPTCPTCGSTDVEESDYPDKGEWYHCASWFGKKKEVKKKCDCGGHECHTCYPDGCECNCGECHDNGCIDCNPEVETEEA